jgi:hypothetical protein
LAGQPSLAAVESALAAQLTQDRSCSPDDAARALRPAGKTDEEVALNLAVITIVLAVTCDDRAGFIDCIHELNDGTASALQQAVQGGMELLPGIDEQAGESDSGKDGAASPASAAAGRAHPTDGGEEEEEEEDSVDVLRAENKALRRETASLREQLAAGGSSAGSAGSGRAGDSAAEGDDEDGELHRDMSVHLHKQVAQLEAALELANTQRDEADADVARLRDDLDISRAAVVDIHRVRKELEEARAEAALLSASVAQAEQAAAEAKARAEAMDKAAEADAARTSGEMHELRKRLKQAERLQREGRFELAGVQTKAAAAGEEVSRLRKLLEATKEAKSMAEARAAAAEAAGPASGPAAAGAAAAAGHTAATDAITAGTGADGAAAAAAAIARLEAEAAVLRAEVRRARAAAAGDGDDAAENAAEEEEQLGRLRSQLAEAEARAIRAESEAQASQARGHTETTARLQASEAEARAAKAEVDAMQAQLRAAKEEFEATTAAAQDEAEAQRRRAETLQSERTGLEQAASVRNACTERERQRETDALPDRLTCAGLVERVLNHAGSAMTAASVVVCVAGTGLDARSACGSHRQERHHVSRGGEASAEPQGGTRALQERGGTCAKWHVHHGPASHVRQCGEREPRDAPSGESPIVHDAAASESKPGANQVRHGEEAKSSVRELMYETPTQTMGLDVTPVQPRECRVFRVRWKANKDTQEQNPFMSSLHRGCHDTVCPQVTPWRPRRWFPRWLRIDQSSAVDSLDKHPIDHAAHSRT